MTQDGLRCSSPSPAAERAGAGSSVQILVPMGPRGGRAGEQENPRVASAVIRGLGSENGWAPPDIQLGVDTLGSCQQPEGVVAHEQSATRDAQVSRIARAGKRPSSPERSLGSGRAWPVGMGLPAEFGRVPPSLERRSRAAGGPTLDLHRMNRQNTLHSLRITLSAAHMPL